MGNIHLYFHNNRSTFSTVANDLNYVGNTGSYVCFLVLKADAFNLNLLNKIYPDGQFRL